MDVVSTGPLRTASLLWQSRPGTPVLTVVCKATFRLQPDESPLADDQEAPVEEDTHWNDDRSRSVYAPSDLAPFKPRADVILVGSAFAPRKEPVRSLVARLIVADIDKSIEVFGERTLTRDGQLRDGFPFTKMPLRYERAAGGPDTANPVGMPVDGEPGPQGTIALPNLQPRPMTAGGGEIPPIGFGPIAAGWPTRVASLGRHTGTWPMPGWMDRPMPEGISPTYFNVAPADQQLESIRDSERILMENLHPEHPRLATALPGLRPRAVVERPGAIPEELKLKADTLWIDTDRSICTLTWRGQVPLKHRVEPGRVVVSVDHSVARLLRGALAGPADRAPQATRPATGAHAIPRIATFSFGGSAPTDDAPPPRAAAPTARGSDKSGVPTPRRASPDRRTHTTGAHATVSIERDPDREEVSMSDMAPLEVPDMLGGGPPTTASPGPLAEGQIPPPPRPITISRSLTLPAGPLEPDHTTPKDARGNGDQEGEAVTPPRVAAGGPRNPREVLKLIWVDPRSLPRLREHRRWKAFLGVQGGQRGSFNTDDNDKKSGEVASSKDRRDALSLLARGEAIQESGIKQALTASIGDDGTLDPPLVLVEGELELPFDELAALKSTVMAASPLTTADEGLEEALTLVRELLKSPWPPASGGLAAGILSRVKGALSGRASSGSMEAHTDRMLLEQRSYQWRTVFGRRWIRGLLRASAEAAETTTVYLPEAMRDELPLYRRIRVKLIGEVDLQEDEAEASGCVIKVIALGRVAEIP